jgi:hypothetical protein
MDISALLFVLGLVIFGLASALWEKHKRYRALEARYRPSEAQQAVLREDYPLLLAEYQEAHRILALKGTIPSRRDVSQREFSDRLYQLGFQSLEEFQHSEEWQRTKRRYRRSDYPQRCLVCGARDFELHHRTYARLGEEELFDLVPLCPTHHHAIHELLDPNPALCVKDTHDYLPLLRKKEVPIPGDKGQDQGEEPELEQRPSRAGRPWSDEEDTELLHCFDQRMAMEEMAKHLHRGVKAVEVRLFKLGRLSAEDFGGGGKQSPLA